MEYPLQLRFKLLALANQIYVNDARGAPVCYVRQKMLKIKEKVDVYTDESMQKLLCQIGADRVIDFSAAYSFIDPAGQGFGSVKRRGMKSFFRSHYEINDENGQHDFTIREENPMAKVFDSLLGEVPIVGFFTGYIFQPKYVITDPQGQLAFRLTKQKSFFESTFTMDKLLEVDSFEELRALMSVLMMALLERRRG